MIFLGLAWSAGEIAALTVFLCLWIASGFGGRLDTEPYQARQYGVMRRFLDLIFRAARRACGLRVTVTGPHGTPAPAATARSSCSAGTPARATRCCSSTTCSARASAAPAWS